MKKQKNKAKKKAKKKRFKRKAGVVVYRPNTDGQMEVLLVTARRYAESWVFPVGTVDKGETLAEAAARECVEESGFIVDIGAEVSKVRLARGKRTDEFTFFLAQVRDETAEYEHDRQRRWVAVVDLPTAVAPVFRDVGETAVVMLNQL